MRRPAFSILELIVAVTVIGILASIVATNFGDSRVRSRDANRRLSVGQYSTSMEQWKAAKGNYFIERDGSCAVRVSGDTLGAIGTGAACVGYRGGSVGQITRISGSSQLSKYKPVSIAQVLLEKGYLSRITTDPSDRGYENKSARDYILTICDELSNVAVKKDRAVEFAVFAHLERPKSDESTTAKQHCGGEETPNGWTTLAYTDI